MLGGPSSSFQPNGPSSYGAQGAGVLHLLLDESQFEESKMVGHLPQQGVQLSFWFGETMALEVIILFHGLSNVRVILGMVGQGGNFMVSRSPSATGSRPDYGG